MSTKSDTRVFSETPWDALDVADLGAAALVPTMLNVDEQTFYVWLTREWAKGQGAVVDLGSFAGGSAACLAEGVAQSENGQTVYGYDKYNMGDFSVFQTRYDRYLATSPARDCEIPARPLPPFSGNDLSPLVEFFLEPWADLFTLVKGQIEQAEWDAGDIEILVMDASKTAETMDRMSATFFPHLIPGHSIVVQQDYLWWQQPWIAAQMALLQDHFEPVAYIPEHSVSFLCTKAISANKVAKLDVAMMNDQKLIQALRAAKQQMKPFGVDWHMRRLIQSVKANEGVRKAFQMQAKP
ncbi:hypothetical protein [uncultured Shimia sp.]|uniref:hypothetical protein n=1 Tax=uncultured Shimia sp. TaxID=573152 RepID=UPI0026261F86|nr:hypothetical protein [uncultured Shimia sp.]